ncbi:amidohydrolase family protein [Georgenia sp. H159]|uniref:amidohydrolase family protein n=1 Tax=Georgenia sp. H159 TaxID=3076115 RepID=UPI002D793FDC|nr:amidohydrolase family protein [Georgenia sp. H159]
MGLTVLRRARLVDGAALVDVHVSDGVVTAVEPAAEGSGLDLEGRLLLPALVEPHAHLDKVFTLDRAANPEGTLAGAMTGYADVVRHFTVEDIAARAHRALRVLVSRGVTAVRTHVGCGRLLGTRGVEALVQVRAELDGLLDLQVVAHVGGPEEGVRWAEHVGILRRALELGADAVGGSPAAEQDPVAALDACFAVAAEAGVPVDFHVDETTDPRVRTLEHLVRLAETAAIPVVASHCVSLGAMSPPEAADLAARAAAAGVAVVTLPATNLYLQGRGSHPVARGITALDALTDAGVAVAAGGDNVCDPFNPVGRLDPLETAALAVVAGHRTPEEAREMVTTTARGVLGLPPAGPWVGARADLVAVRADSWGEALALAPEERLVLRGGTVVSETTVSRSGPVHEGRPGE